MTRPPLLSRRHALQGLTLGTLFLLPGCSEAASPPRPQDKRRTSTPAAAKLIAAAREQIGLTLAYDPAYVRLAFPGGDVPRAKGVCTDVVIRAYRDAFGVDLQALVNADMKADFGRYPKIWGLAGPDSNIDHRRVPNLRTFLTGKGAALPVTRNAKDWQPGDIFTSMVGGKLPHIGIVSDRTANGRPLAIHNIGSGTKEEDVLFAHDLNGHFRWRLA